MRGLLADSANRRNVKIYLTLAEAVRAQYEEANEKLYLKEGYDTAAFLIRPDVCSLHMKVLTA